MRNCKGCTACCFALDISEMQKPACTDCSKQSNHGCREYESRPDVCKKFECLWLKGQIGQTHDKPSELGIVFSGGKSPVLGLYIRVAECWQGAAQQPRAAKLVAACMQSFPVCIFGRDGKRRIHVSDKIPAARRTEILEALARIQNTISEPLEPPGEHDDEAVLQAPSR